MSFPSSVRPRLRGVVLATGVLFVSSPAFSQTGLAERIRSVMERPEFAHARFGIEFCSPETGEVVYARNEHELFTPASTTKLLTEGTLLASLGASYRFRTRIYRTGPVDPKGRLKGDLVLLASGDPNLSNRILPDGTLAFEDEDHAYGGPAVAGDPLAVIRELAADVAGGIHVIEGRILVDASLVPDGPRDGGTNVVISSIVVNDNVIDLLLRPGAEAGEPVILETSPETAYIRFVNQVVTVAAGEKNKNEEPVEVIHSDGTVTVTLRGSIPAGAPAVTAAYPVPSPTRFAESVMREALADAGVRIEPPSKASPPDFASYRRLYTEENAVAEHVSPPLSEEVKVTLKVSQNLHAGLGPYLLGALLAQDSPDRLRAGFEVERKFLETAKLDLTEASQGDGEGGDRADLFSPDFMCRYLSYWTARPDFDVFFQSLPVLGKDGTLAKIQQDSPAAGHVFAKTGTFGSEDKLGGQTMLNGKGLAGYVLTASGTRLAFAAYVNHVHLPSEPAPSQIAGQALGEIAAAVYDAPRASRETRDYDIIIRNGKVIDGTGNPWYAADVAVRGDRIVEIGNLRGKSAATEIDATGRVVSPGFIDMLGQSELSLLLDNRAVSKLAQGISTEITGEGGSVAPQNENTLAPFRQFLTRLGLTVDWTTLDGYFRRLEKQGTALNLGTYVGSAQVREAVLGDDDRAPTPEELERMKALVEGAMKDGALGVSSALIYPPNSYAETEELIELARVASRYGGLYATHMRSEGASEMEALAEAIRIGREAALPVEIFHLKVSGKPRWGNMKKVVAAIQAARDSGLDIAADMYPYTAGGTALASALPPWIADGGVERLLERLKDPTTRQRVKNELAGDHPDWENLFFDVGGAEGVLLASIASPDLKKFEGKRLAEVAAEWKKSPEDTLMDFVLQDRAQTGAIYFMAAEEDLMTGLRQSFTSIGLDANAMALDGPTYEPHTHPRAFGSMARYLGHYVRDQHLMPLETAIRKITSLPAQRCRLTDRGLLRAGYFADITVFDAASIIDHATYAKPDELSTGVDAVLVNGKLELFGGRPTGVTAGRVLRGPGFDPPQPSRN